MNFKRQTAFTLAEVLITLLIIGVIASIVIPDLIADSQQAEYKVAYKKAYVDANLVWRQMVMKSEVTARTNDGYDENAALQNFNAFKSYFKVIKECGFDGGSNAGCWDFTGGQIKPAGTMFVPLQSTGTSYAAFIDTQGRQWLKNQAGATFGEIIYLDINGFTGPNKFGKDRFGLFPLLSTCPAGGFADLACKGNGIPVSVKPYPDDTDNVSNPNICNVDKCYYRSWLIN
jgi:prepilin-type N-terminal cleavage/methylation domain-containing protein